MKQAELQLLAELEPEQYMATMAALELKNSLHTMKSLHTQDDIMEFLVQRGEDDYRTPQQVEALASAILTLIDTAMELNDIAEQGGMEKIPKRRAQQKTSPALENGKKKLADAIGAVQAAAKMGEGSGHVDALNSHKVESVLRPLLGALLPEKRALNLLSYEHSEVVSP